MDTKIFIDNETEAYMDHIFSQIFPDCSKEEVAQWMRSSPANTVLRVELDKSSTADFAEKLEAKFELDVKSYQILTNDVIEDVVVVTDSKVRKDVKPDDQIVVVGSMCGAAVLRGADIYLPGKIKLRKFPTNFVYYRGLTQFFKWVIPSLFS